MSKIEEEILKLVDNHVKRLLAEEQEVNERRLADLEERSDDMPTRADVVKFLRTVGDVDLDELQSRLANLDELQRKFDELRRALDEVRTATTFNDTHRAVVVSIIHEEMRKVGLSPEVPGPAPMTESSTDQILRLLREIRDGLHDNND